MKSLPSSSPKAETAKGPAFTVELSMNQVKIRFNALVTRQKQLINQMQAAKMASDMEEVRELKDVYDTLDTQRLQVNDILRTSQKMKREELYQAFYQKHGSESPEQV